MKKIQELNGVNCIDSEDLSNAAKQLLYSAQLVIELQNPKLEASSKLTTEQEIKAQMQILQKNPLLVTGIAVLATLERFRVDFSYQQNATQLLLQDLVESIDCAGAKAPLADDVITALRNEQFLAGLNWLRQNPQHTDQEYLDAMAEIEKLVGL